MASRNRGNNERGRSSARGQRSAFGWTESARDNPLTTAAAVGGAVAAGVFLWSRRNQISEQLSNLSDQIGEWTDSMRSGGQGAEFETAGAEPAGMLGGEALGGGSPTRGSTRATGSSGTNRSPGGKGASGRSGSRTSRRTGMSETGGGNASLGAHGGTSGPRSGL